MNRTTVLLAAGLALAASPIHAEDKQRPMTDQTVTAKDVAATPIDDLNLRSKKVPEVLIAAQQAPYSLAGIRGCAGYARAIRNLDGALGDDIDVAQAKGQKVDMGRLAKSAVSSFIPFEGVIKEISGANAHERAVQTAIYAGSVRRAFLKGMGQARGCPYPARAATRRDVAMVTEQRDRALAEAKDKRREATTPRTAR